MKIRNLVPISCWDHCAGKDHPADIFHALELSVSKLWRSGPNWLETTLSSGSALLPEAVSESCILEMKAADRKMTHNVLSTSELITASSVIDCEQYSTIHKLYRVTVLVLKFINLLRKRATSSELTAQDYLVLRGTGCRIVRDT